MVESSRRQDHSSSPASACIAPIRRQSLRNPAYQTLAPATPRRTLPLFPIPTFLSGASNTAAVGAIGLRPVDDRRAALSYAVLAEARGQGFASRAVRLLAEAAFAHGFTRLEIRTDVDNVASQRVAERAGFIRDRVAVGTGVYRNYAPFAGAARDEVFYVLGVTG